MNNKIQAHKDSVVDVIDNCKTLNQTEKIFYKDLLTSSSECTNGLSQEEKLQKTTESVFYLTTLVILARCHQKNNKETLFKTITDCKWAIVITVGILAILLLFRPELSNILTKFL